MKIHNRKCFNYFALVIQWNIIQTLHYSYKVWIVKYKKSSVSDSIGHCRMRNFRKSYQPQGHATCAAFFFLIVVQLQLSAFSPHPSPHSSQTHLPPCAAFCTSERCGGGGHKCDHTHFQIGLPQGI